MKGVVLALNVGSSSLKFALFDDGNGSGSDNGNGDVAHRRLLSGAIDRIGLDGGRMRARRSDGTKLEREGRFQDGAAAIDAMFALLDEERVPPPAAVGHRLVHGGPAHTKPARLDDDLRKALRGVVAFAPLHLPAELDAVDAVQRRAPSLPQVACFDTAFHARLPAVAARLPLALPHHDAGLRRYGFHGLSYEYIVEKLGARLGARAIVAHLGNGASLAALRDGVSIDTTMGLTPDGGIMMGTRTGDLDPGVVLHLMRAGHDADALARMLEREAGLRGVSGVSSDMKELLSRRAADPSCALAVAMFTYGVQKAIGAFVAALGGVDTLVFTGGIGENASEIRAESCASLAALGIRIDEQRNRAGTKSAKGTKDAIISPDGAACTVHVVATDEEHVVARRTREVLGP